MFVTSCNPVRARMAVHCRELAQVASSAPVAPSSHPPSTYFGGAGSRPGADALSGEARDRDRRDRYPPSGPPDFLDRDLLVPAKHREEARDRDSGADVPRGRSQSYLADLNAQVGGGGGRGGMGWVKDTHPRARSAVGSPPHSSESGSLVAALPVLFLPTRWISRKLQKSWSRRGSGPLSGQRCRRVGSSGTLVTAGPQGRVASGSGPQQSRQRRLRFLPIPLVTMQGAGRVGTLVGPGTGLEAGVVHPPLHRVPVPPPPHRTPSPVKQTRPLTVPGSSRR